MHALYLLPIACVGTKFMRQCQKVDKVSLAGLCPTCQNSRLSRPGDQKYVSSRSS
jgi:hypothetical protein